MNRIHYSSLAEHLIELKKRVFYAAIAYALAIAVCGYFASDIFAFIVRPLAELADPLTHRMIYTGMAEGFLTLLRITLWAGFGLAFPVIAAQLWIFIAPGLYGHEKRGLVPFFIGAPILFLSGAALAYYAIIPLTWKFFLGFEMPSASAGLPVQFEARISEYLNFTLQFIMAFGLAFQMPLVLLLLGRIGILKAGHLKKFRRYAIILIFVAAAILTPSPDMIGQTAMAVPLLILYELSILMVKSAEKSRDLKDKEAINTDNIDAAV